MAVKAKTPEAVSGRKYLKERQTGVPMTVFGMAVLGALCLGAGLWAATQYCAYEWGFDPRLGAPAMVPKMGDKLIAYAAAAVGVVLGVVSIRSPERRRFSVLFVVVGIAAVVVTLGPIYPPGIIFEWARWFKGHPDAEAVLATSRQVGMAVAAVFGLAAFLAASDFQRKRVSNSKGTAEFGEGGQFAVSKDEQELLQEANRENKLADLNGVIIGRASDTGQLMLYRGDSHVLAMAPTRSGKGVGLVIPNLLYYPGSVVVTDIKGENFLVTHKRRIAMGQTVVALDPFGVTTRGGSQLHPYVKSFNPMDMIDVVGERKEYAVDDAMQLAAVLVDSESTKEKFWSEEAKALLMGIILHVAVEGQMGADCNLLEVRRILTLPGEEFQEVLELMGHSPNVIVRRTAARLLQKDEKERSGVVSTAQANTNFLDSASMQKVLKETSPDFDIRRLKPNRALAVEEQPMAIYLIIPPSYLESHAAWLRLMIICAMRALTDSLDKPKRRVLFLLDEFANLGYMQPIMTGISLAAGFGALLWPIIQDMAQLKGIYKEKAQSLFGNCDVKVCFGTNDIETAKMLSEMMGETTIFSESGSITKGRNFGRQRSSSHNAGESAAEASRKLLNPDEIMRMRPWEMLCFLKGEFPILGTKVEYFKDAEFNKPRKLWDDNPMM